MNIKEIERRPYEVPLVEVITFPRPLHLLVTVSLDAAVEDWETGEDL